MKHDSCIELTKDFKKTYILLSIQDAETSYQYNYIHHQCIHWYNYKCKIRGASSLWKGQGCMFQKGAFRAFWADPRENFENWTPKTPFCAISDVLEGHICHFSWRLEGTFRQFRGQIYVRASWGQGFIPPLPPPRCAPGSGPAESWKL